MNPYQSPDSDPTPLDEPVLCRSYRRAVQAAMAGGVLCVLAGFAITSLTRQPHNLILIPSAVLSLTTLAVCLLYSHAARELSHLQRDKANVIVALIWLPLSWIAFAQLFSFAIGFYNPVLHDNLRVSIWGWLAYVTFMTLQAIGCTLAYLYNTRAEYTERYFNRYVTASWLVQIVTMAAFGLYEHSLVH